MTQPYLVYAGIHVAEREGYFAEQGLEVEFVPMPGSEVSSALLVGGAVDVLPSHATPGLLNAIARGEPLRMVASRSRRTRLDCEHMALVIRPDLRRPEGVTPAVHRFSSDRQAAMRWFMETALAQNGIALDSLDEVFVPHAAEADAFRAGSIDAALAGEPFLSRLLEAGVAELWIGTDEAQPEVEHAHVFFGSRLLEDERDVGVRFLVAWLNAHRQLGAGPTERNIALVAEVTGESPDALRRMCWPFAPTDGRIREDHLRAFQEWAVRHALIDRVQPLSELADTALMAVANTELEQIAAQPAR